jgi:hypothetical protein
MAISHNIKSYSFIQIVKLQWHLGCEDCLGFGHNEITSHKFLFVFTDIILQNRECFSIRVLVLDYLFFSPNLFSKSNSNCQIEKHVQLSEASFNFNSTFLDHIISNN